MNTHFKYLLSSINFKLKDKPLFYISSEAERALGLERILKNFHIVCIENDEIVNFLTNLGINVFSFNKETNNNIEIYKSSAKLLDQNITKEYIQKYTKNKNFYIQTFKISNNFEYMVSTQFPNTKILNTSSTLNKLFEEKISQYKLLSKGEINFPKTILTKLKDTSYIKLRLKLGSKFVIQFNRGHTGKSTYFITSKEEFNKLKNIFPDRIARISKYINGSTFTLNGVVSKNGIFMGGLSYQITGVKNLTSRKGGTIGNDFYFRKNINSKILNLIIKEVTKIGNILKDYKYLGLFGVDFISDGKKIYIIEINARQPASIPFYTKIQLKQNRIPLSMLHLTEFLEISNDININDYNHKNLEPIKASQVFIRNNDKIPFLIKSNVKTGIYRLRSGDSAYNIIGGHRYKKKDVIFLDEEQDKPLVFENNGISIEDIKDGGMVVLTKPKHSRINPQEEIARIQVMQNVVDSNAKLYNWVIESLSAIKSYMK